MLLFFSCDALCDEKERRRRRSVLTLGSCWQIHGSSHSHQSLRRRTCHGLQGASRAGISVSFEQASKKKNKQKTGGKQRKDEKWTRKPLEKEEEGEQGRKEKIEPGEKKEKTRMVVSAVGQRTKKEGERDGMMRR